jgi:hypothetical protein
MIPATKAVAAKDGGYTVTIPAYSFTVLSNIDEVTLPAEGETAPSETEPTPETTPADEVPKETVPAESATHAPEETSPETQPAEKKGCGSSVTVTGGLLTTAIAGAVLALRKKKED